MLGVCADVDVVRQQMPFGLLVVCAFAGGGRPCAALRPRVVLPRFSLGCWWLALCRGWLRLCLALRGSLCARVL